MQRGIKSTSNFSEIIDELQLQVKQSKVFITEIDMSSVFDTIRRESLIQVLDLILEVHTLRMIRVLL